MCWRYCFPASRNYTSVKITPTPSGDVKTLTLEAGGYYEFELPSRESVIVRSNKTVLLAQLCKSFKADDTRNSDPFMTLITPTSQISNYYVYSTPGLDRYKHYVNIFVDTSHIDGIRLDGRALEDPDFLSDWRNAGRNYAVAKLKMVPGVHVLTHANHARFGATAYGFKKQESYGFSLGFYARDYREDFPPKATTTQVRTTTRVRTTTQVRTTTRQVYATTTFVNTPGWTLARSTDGTTVDERQADAARTVDSVPTTTTMVVGDVMPTTSTMTIPYSRERDGMTNVTSSWNSSDARGNVSSADNSTISIQRNTTITPTLDNSSTVIHALNASTTAVPVPTDEPFDNKERTTIHVTSDRTFDPRNEAISKNYTDIPSATTTTPSDNSNMTALFQSESTVSSSHVSATSATGTVRIGSMVTKTEMSNDSATSSNTASTLSHVHTPTHTVSGVESVNVTMNNIASAFNDTTTISSTNVEGNESIRTTTEAMLLNENTTENDALADELSTSATLSILTALISSRWNLDNLKHSTTPAKQLEPVNAASTDSKEPSPFASVNNSDTSSKNEPNTRSSTTQIRFDMTLATEPTFQNVMNMTPDRVTEPPSRNYSDTTTHGINVDETRQPNSTHASPPNISETSTTHASAPNISVANTTHMSVPILSHSVPVSTRVSSLDTGTSFENVTFRQSLENKTTPGISTATIDSWNNETQANATIPTNNPVVYLNDTTEQWLVEPINNTQIENESETIAKEANLTAVTTFINASTQTTKSSITTIRIAKDTMEDGSVNVPTMSPSIVRYVESTSSLNSTLPGLSDNTSLQENISSLGSNPSTSVEVTSISPIENVTSSVQTKEVTDILEYIKKINHSTQGYTESYQRQFNETAPISHALKKVGESIMSSFPNNNDTSYTSIVTSQYTILTTGSSEPTHKTTTYSTLEAIDDTDIAKPHDNRATTIEIPSVVVKTSKNALVTSPDHTHLMTPASTTTDQSTSASATTDVEVTFGPDGHSEQGTTYPLATTGTDGISVNNSPQSPTHDINLSTAIDTINQQNRNTLTTPTSVVTPIAQEMSAKKDDIKLMVTIIVATLFGLPLLVICGCLCYGLCCGICRKHGRGSCCGCAKRRRRNSRVRPTSQWSSSSQRSASSSRSSMVYIDPSVLESKGLVPQPQRKRKLDFLNFYQKPSCSSWVEVVDEQADDNNKRRDHRSARSAKDLRGKVKGKGKRRMNSYERNRKVGPTLDDRPPLPRTSTNSRMQSYIVRN